MLFHQNFKINVIGLKYTYTFSYSNADASFLEKQEYFLF